MYPNGDTDTLLCADGGAATAAAATDNADVAADDDAEHAEHECGCRCGYAAVVTGLARPIDRDDGEDKDADDGEDKVACGGPAHEWSRSYTR